MVVLLWNIRGSGKKARVRQLRELMNREQVEIVGVQETIKQDFSDQELLSLSADFQWRWISARGHLGGILKGVKDSLLQVEEWIVGEYFIEATIKHRGNNFRWVVMVVYGPTQHEFSGFFLEELASRLENRILPTLLGGDFNLIRTMGDKSSGLGDAGLISMFNSFIEDFDLREIQRIGDKFTWTNKQDNPVSDEQHR
ncbi:hypothetical protein GQ55_5G345000 [Panicum hallii var. hallii]|uniref:Endonuclease/exonuclease/phosphatase domain-containing protein n=1 Tax=Panicum hallii var. hallii TaxID=1504633 RepID=A0A2T7DM67_9POAL|nr:hypothetical protein GQ55_5G345000 [Panicum hallii var. hallii]